MAVVCILVTGRPVASAQALRGSFADMIRAASGDAWAGDWQDLDATSSEPLSEHVAAVVITGSSASVTERADWMLAREAELRRLAAAGKPVLGICFGHQLLAQALGGLVERNPFGREIGTVSLESPLPDPVLGDARLVNMSHVDAVVALPPGAEVLARTERDPNSVVRFGSSLYGVQFHPEFDREIVSCYLRERRAVIEQEGLDADALAAGARDTPEGAAVVRRFLQRVRSGGA
jgi:GMP synthase (glutamine-hydrolysing)